MCFQMGIWRQCQNSGTAESAELPYREEHGGSRRGAKKGQLRGGGEKRRCGVVGELPILAMRDVRSDEFSEVGIAQRELTAHWETLRALGDNGRRAASVSPAPGSRASAGDDSEPRVGCTYAPGSPMRAGFPNAQSVRAAQFRTYPKLPEETFCFSFRQFLHKRDP
jgi:hypothetical protein